MSISFCFTVKQDWDFWWQWWREGREEAGRHAPKKTHQCHPFEDARDQGLNIYPDLGSPGSGIFCRMGSICTGNTS